MPEYVLPLVEHISETITKAPRVVFVTSHHVASLEYMGPLQVFDELRFFLDDINKKHLAYRTEFVSIESGPIYQRPGLAINVSKPYHRLRGPIDTLIFQSVDHDDEWAKNKRFLDWVRHAAPKARRIVSICTGAFILAEAGLLDGRTATTHWCACDDFKRRYPRVNLNPNPLYAKDGNIYTSAGATAGVDLALALLEEDFGSEMARRVAQGLVLYLRRPGDQAQFCTNPLRAPEDSRMAEVRDYIDAHLSEDLRVENLAERFHMSPRNFSRVFKRSFGRAPGKYVEERRLECARRQLETTDAPVSRIARQFGYSSTAGLRLAFDRHLGITPREYRRRFVTARR